MKDTWAKPKGVGSRVGGGDGGVRGHGEVKMETVVLEQQLRKRNDDDSK